jgi:ribosomal protein L29
VKFKELEGLSKQELLEKINDLHKQLMELQFKRRSGVEKPHMFKLIRRDIARIHTVMSSKKEVNSAKR